MNIGIGHGRRVADVTTVDNLTSRIVARARQLGFASVGIVPAQPLPHLGEFQAWLDAGYHGTMSYLERGSADRAEPGSLLQGARTVIALTSLYAARDQGDGEGTGPGRIARYAQGYDYHRVIEERLERLAGFIRAETGAEVASRPCVDRLPLLERDVAWLAGLGWFGKNTMILSRKLGSWFFLSELVVDVELDSVGTPVTDHCGSCTACLDACPTNAFVGRYVLDARRCISYLTIELRGPIPRALRPAVGDHLFGCDICQDVCPWNAKAPDTNDFPFLGRPEIQGLSADQILLLSPLAFRERFELSPVQRARRPGLLRNAAVVLGNSGDDRWIPLLAHTLAREEEPLVRGHAAWALGRLGGRWAERSLALAAKTETDPYVLEEIDAARAPPPLPPPSPG
jgi:epoxyqueuosine reductase